MDETSEGAWRRPHMVDWSGRIILLDSWNELSWILLLECISVQNVSKVITISSPGLLLITGFSSEYFENKIAYKKSMENAESKTTGVRQEDP